MTKSELFKRAWQIAREAKNNFGGSVKSYFAASLKLAWEESKKMGKKISEIIEKIFLEKDKALNMDWKETVDLENGIDVKGAYTGGVRIEIEKNKLHISQYGFKSYNSDLKKDIESFRKEIEKKLGLEHKNIKTKKTTYREVDECDGGFQDYRY